MRAQQVTGNGLLRATSLALALALAAACDCGGSRVGQATTGVTLVEPAGEPEQFERNLDFGAVRVATLATRKIILRNDGRTGATITKAELVGDNADFFLAGAAPLPLLDAKQTWEIELRYMPSTMEADTATVIIETDVVDTPKYTIHVTGRGAASKVDVCTTPPGGTELCASTQPDYRLVVGLGSAKPEAVVKRAIQVKNLGDAALNVSSIAPSLYTSGEFTVAPNNGPVQVAAAAKADYEVVYAPVDGGSDEGLLEIRSDDPDRPTLQVVLQADGLAPRVCVKPGIMVDFGDQTVGSTAHKTITIESCGREALRITGLTMTASTHPNVFGIGTPPALPLEIPAGGKLELDGTYAPTEFGEDFGGIMVASNDPGSPLGRISLHGRGVGCDLVAVPSPVSFGLVSTTGRTSKTVQISNHGTGDCAISEIRPPALPFAIDTQPPVPVNIGPGQQQSLLVSFKPTANGVANDKIVIVSNDDGGNLEIPLTGQGRPAPPCDLQANPTSLVFTNVATGASATLNVVLTNYGTDECYLGGGKFNPTSAPYSVTLGGFPPSSVAAGGTLTVPVKFTPTQAGQHNATLTIDACDQVMMMGTCLGGTMSHLNIALSGGTLEPKLCVVPDQLDFGSVAAGTQAEQTFTITSCGAGALGIRGVTLQTGTSLDFSFAQPRVRTPQFLASSQSLQVRMIYKPRTNGADFGAVELLTNDPTTPRFLLKMRGNAGTVCDKQLACAFEKLTFPTMEIGRTSSLSDVCQNIGTQPVTVTGITYAAGTSPDFTATVGRVPQVLQPGDTVRLGVNFTPSQALPRTGTVIITADTCVPARVDLEGNGMAPHYPPCPPPQIFQPVTKWEWSGGSVMSNSKNVMMSPMVVNLTDDNGDGNVNEGDVPDVIFSSCGTGECCINCMAASDPKMMDVSGKSMLRAVHGNNGRDLWSVTDATLKLTGDAQIAVGDLDGDNFADIVAVKHCFQPGTSDTGMEGKYTRGTLLVFDHKGQLKFETEQWKGDEKNIEMGGAPVMGDVDSDGSPEILFEGTLFRANGQKLFDLANGAGDDGHGGFPILTDLDGDGFQEIVTGKHAYRRDGTLLWERQPTNPPTCDESASSPGGTCVCNPGKTDLGWITKRMCAMAGPTMVLDVDKDNRPEIVLREAPTQMLVLDSTTGAAKYGPWSWAVPEGVCSASMSAADLDGDGKPELVVPTGDKLRAFRFNGQELWSAEIVDHGGQCGASGAAAFDFEGDGKWDVVYGDTSNVWVFRGTDGTKIFTGARNSSTLFETPVIADVDNDSHADIIMTNENGILGIGQVAGLRVFSNQGNNWPATRRIWNQHSYHVSDVNDNGTIPRVETPHWKADNMWRSQPPLCRR